MKRTLFTALAICLALVVAQAQPASSEDRVNAYRIAVFTEVLQLTSDEAAAFWPIYNEYLDQRETLRKQLKPTKQLDAMSDVEVENQIKAHFELQQRELDLEKDLYAKLRKVLPVRKIAKLPLAERRFRESIIQRANEKANNPPTQRRPGVRQR